MQDYQSQSHVKWDCKYHIVWCPKYRRKKLYGRLRKRFGEIIHELCRWSFTDADLPANRIDGPLELKK